MSLSQAQQAMVEKFVPLAKETFDLCNEFMPAYDAPRAGGASDIQDANIVPLYAYCLCIGPKEHRQSSAP